MGRAAGVVTEAGDIFRARMIVSNLNPKLLFQRLVDPARLPADFQRAHRPLSQRLRHIPHECRAERAAAIHLPAGAGRPH